MTDKRTDPVEYHEIWKAKLECAVEAFMNNEFPMTEPVFKATLFSLGYRGQVLDAEFRMYVNDKYEKDKLKRT